MLPFQGLVSAEHKWFWIHLETKTCNRPFWFSCMKADLTFSETPSWPSLLLNMVVIHSMMYLYCVTLCVLSVIQDFLLVPGKTLDIWSISTDLVSDQELLLASWYLMFLNIKVFLRDLFFSSSIWLSNLYNITNCFKLFTYFISLFFHFKL